MQVKSKCVERHICWPTSRLVLVRWFVEAIYLLSDQPVAQEALWEMLGRGALLLLPLDSSDIPRIRELMRKCANRPMDLADAAPLRVAEREGLRKIFTVDRRDFSLYRLNNRWRPPSFHNCQSLGAKPFIPPSAPRRPILECQF